MGPDGRGRVKGKESFPFTITRSYGEKGGGWGGAKQWGKNITLIPGTKALLISGSTTLVGEGGGGENYSISGVKVLLYYWGKRITH